MHISALNITCYTVFELQIDTYAWHMAFISVSVISHTSSSFVSGSSVCSTHFPWDQ